MKQKPIVLITTQDDQHTHALITYLKSQDKSYLCLEREMFGKTWVASATLENKKVEITFNVDGKVFHLDELGAFWLRREMTVETTEQDQEFDAESQLYVATQKAIHFNGLLRYISTVKPFMNTPMSNWHATSKFHQLTLARECGLKIPNTFMGGSSTAAHAFLENNTEASAICIKALEAIHLKRPDGTVYAHFTRLFKRRGIDELVSLHSCPVILQSFIEKHIEIRATVVGDRIFATSIDTSGASAEAKIDWRHYDWANTPYFPISLPNEVEQKLIQLIRRFNLVYGAIDLIQNPQGEYYFLEVNSMGQWLWIQDLTELPITEAIGDWLIQESF